MCDQELDLETCDADLIQNVNEEIFSTSRQVKRITLLTLIKCFKQEPTLENYVNTLNNLKDDDLMGILNLVYRKNSASHFEKSENALLEASVVLVFVRVLMKKWDGFPKYFKSKYMSDKDIQDKLVKYLKHNLNHIIQRNSDVIGTLERKSEDTPNTTVVEEGGGKSGKVTHVNVECSYNKLKTLFLMDPSTSDKTLINYCEEDSTADQVNFQLAEFPFGCLFNWSFVSVTLNTPLYTVTCENIHEFDYKLVQLTKGYLPSVKKKEGKVLKKEEPNAQLTTSSDIVDYLYKAIKAEGNDISEIRHATKTVYNIKEVISKIGKIIKFNASYTLVVKETYVRYLGQLKHFKKSGPVVNAGRQKLLNEGSGSVNVRLQEVIHPKLMITITKNDPVAVDTKLSVSFSCSLCGSSFEGRSSEMNLKRHLILEHGQEPDWFCVCCDQSYSMKKLTLNRWSHCCPGSPKRISMVTSIINPTSAGPSRLF